LEKVIFLLDIDLEKSDFLLDIGLEKIFFVNLQQILYVCEFHISEKNEILFQKY
jgi:hypothetical protein